MTAILRAYLAVKITGTNNYPFIAVLINSTSVKRLSASYSNNFNRKYNSKGQGGVAIRVLHQTQVVHAAHRVPVSQVENLNT